MASQPGRDWAGRDLAALLGIKPRNMLTQLAEWTRLGFLATTGPGRYALPAPPGQATASAAPAAGQHDPAPPDIIAVTTQVTGEAAGTHAPSLPPRHRFPRPQAPRVVDGKPARRAGPLTARAPQAVRQQAVSGPPKRL